MQVTWQNSCWRNVLLYFKSWPYLKQSLAVINWIPFPLCRLLASPLRTSYLLVRLKKLKAWIVFKKRSNLGQSQVKLIPCYHLHIHENTLDGRQTRFLHTSHFLSIFIHLIFFHSISVALTFSQIDDVNSMLTLILRIAHCYISIWKKWTFSPWLLRISKLKKWPFPANAYLFKVNKHKHKKEVRCMFIKSITSLWYHSGILVFLLLTLRG